MADLKILQLSSERTWRGGEQQIAYLIQYLRSQDVEVVVCARKNSAFSEWCANNEIRYYELGFKNGVDIQTALRLKAIATKENVDIVHSHSGKSHSLAYLALKCGMQKPLVVHRRVDFPIKNSGFSSAKYNSENIKAIICVSNAIAKMVSAAVAMPEKVKTVYSGIDPNRFLDTNSSGFLHQEFGIDRSKKLIANISAIAPHKDYETFLNTVRRVADCRDDCHFLIVGEGSLRESMQDLATKLNLNNRVTFTGFRTDVPKIFRELTLFLITSDTEGLGTTVIDAMYNGIPVVATRAGGIPELVTDGIEGSLCNVGDADCLARRLKTLLDSDELLSRAAASAKLKAKDFTYEKMGEGVLKIYREIFQHGL